MARDKKTLLDSLLDRQGTLFSEELGIDLSRNTPSSLFRWLCASLLLSARIPHKIAMKAAKALSDAGWTTAQHMVASGWTDRVAVLKKAGYGRFDESTASMLGDTAQALQTTYDGDLRNLREGADRDPTGERERLMAFKGIGPAGADIFLREIQGVWPEHYPFADAKAIAAATRLGLSDTCEGLSEMVGRKRFPALVAALVRAELTGVTPDDLCAHSNTAEAS